MRTLATLCLAVLLAACGGDRTDSNDGGAEPAAPSKAVRAATIANEIAANPDNAEAILKEHGMTEAEFEALMFEIAEDEALSEAYEKARGG